MVKFTIDKHHVCFPSKLLAGNGGAHIYNVVLSEDTDNGTIIGKGAYVSFDQYEQATAPTKYEGIITEQAADGNWYVEVVEPADALLVDEVEDIPYTNYDSRFTDLANFYNAKEDVVRAYALCKGDVYELSEDAFTGTPAPGKKVTVSGQKHVVAGSTNATPGVTD